MSMRPRLLLAAVSIATAMSAFGQSATPGQSNSVPTALSARSTDRITITTLTGQIYTNCKVTRIEPDGLTVFYAKGIAKIPFTDLSEDYRIKYGYDPEKASAYGRSVAQTRAAAAARQQEYQRRQQAEQAQDQAAQDAAKKAAVANQLPAATGPAVNIRGKVLQVVEDGLIIRGVSLVADDQSAAQRRASGWGSYKGSYVGKDKRYYDSDQTVFVFTSPKSHVDGSDFNMMCFPCGTHSYENVMGGGSTVKAFKTSK